MVHGLIVLAFLISAAYVLAQVTWVLLGAAMEAKPGRESLPSRLAIYCGAAFLAWVCYRLAFG